jgi:small subunit ribosomal protein S18
MDTNSTNADPTALASDIFASMPGRKSKVESRRLVEQELTDMQSQDDHMRQMTRKWNFGDVYSPHDLSPAEMDKWKKSLARKQDLVDILGVRPLDMYRVGSLFSPFLFYTKGTLCGNCKKIGSRSFFKLHPRQAVSEIYTVEHSSFWL